MLPKNAVKLGSNDLNELILILLNNALKIINSFKKKILSGELKKHRQELSEAIQASKEDIAALKGLLNTLNEELNECILMLSERKDKNIKEECKNIKQKKAIALNELRSSTKEKKNEIDQITIGYDKYILYKGIRYERYSEYSLKTTMHYDLENQSENVRQNIKSEINKITRTTTEKIKSYWEEKEKDIKDKFQIDRSNINAEIDKIKKSKAVFRSEYDRLLNIEQNIMSSPTKIEIAKSIPLSIPLFTKNLSTLAFKDSAVVRVKGGTGFKLNNQKLSNTALVRNLSDELNKQSSHFPVKSDNRNLKEGIENWQPISVNNQHYQAFYVSHQHYNDGYTKELEFSIQKPSMAKNSDEKRLLQLAAQTPSQEQIEEIKKLATNGVQLDKTDAYGNTALHLAAMNNNDSLLRLLLAYYKDIVLHNQFGNSPLHIAAMYGHDAALAVLMSEALVTNNDASTTLLTMNDESALYLAVLHNNLSTVKLLIDYGSDINEVGINGLPLIYTSLFNGALETTEYLLGLPEIILDFQLENGNTLLHLAVKLNHTGFVQELINNLVDLDIINKNGQSPLHIAVEHGYFEIVNLLLRSDKFLLNQPNSSGYPALYLAIKHGHPIICEHLLKMGAISNQLINKGNALTLALQFRQVNCVRMILQHTHYKIDLDDQIDLDNFHVICKLGLWESARAIVVANPKALDKQLKEAAEHDLNEPTCYIDYLCKANAFSQFDALFKSTITGNKAAPSFAIIPTTRDIAFTYTKKNIKKIYHIAITSASQEILRCLTKHQMINPFHDDEKMLLGNGENNWLYNGYDLIQYAFRHNIILLCNNYLKNLNSDIERATVDNKNLAFLVAESGNKNLLKNLIERHAQLYSPNGKHIFYALVTNNQHHIIRELVLSYNLDINTIINKNNGMRAIDLACKLGNIDTILALIACGSQIDEPNSENKLAIHYSIESNALHAVRLIFKYELGGLEPMLSFAILHHKNNVFKQIIGNQNNYVSHILACSNKLLPVAIEARNLDAFKLLLRLGAKPDPSLLHLTVINNQTAMLKLLLDTEIDVNLVDEDNNTAFHLACKHENDLIILELLKNKKLNKTIRNNKKQLAIDLASEWVIKVVLTNNMNVIAKNLIDVISEGNLFEFKNLLVHHRIPLNTKIAYSHSGNISYYSLLEVAILEGNKDIIEYLLSQPEIKSTEINSLGLTAVHLLMKLSDAQFIVEMIEKFNLNVRVSNAANGITPLHYVMLINNPALINYLVVYGADIYAEDIDNKTIMELAIDNKSLDSVKLLIEEHRYNLNHKSTILESPLSVALKTGNLAIAKYLVSQGANVLGIDGFNCRSMLHQAVISQDIKTVHYVLTLGIDEKIQDNKQMLALHLAAKQGNVDIVELLSNSNPLLIQATDMRGRDANDFALVHRKTEVSCYISKRYGNIFKNRPTLDNIIRFKKYRLGGRTQLELAIVAEDQTNIERLIVAIKPTDSDAIERAIYFAGASANHNIFIYVLNQLWDQKDHKVIRNGMMSAIVNNRTANLKEILKIIGSEIVFEDGCSAVELACKYNAQESLRCLLDYNQVNFIYPSLQNLYLALKSTIDNNSVSLAKMLIESCDSGWEDFVDSNGDSLLHHAVAKNQAQMLALFIMVGVNDVPNHADITAKQLAQRDDKYECLKYLNFVSNRHIIESKDDKAQNNGLVNYLEDSSRTLDYELFQWLCSFQDINAANGNGSTPLHTAIHKGDQRAINILLTANADMLIKDKNGCSALMQASNSDPNIEKVMFQHVLKDSLQLNSAFKDLCTNKNYYAVKELRKLLASEKMFNKNDPINLYKDIRLWKTSIYSLFSYENCIWSLKTILHMALDMEEISLCDFIISNGRNLDNRFNTKEVILAKDKYGNTVIHKAILLNNLDLLKNILTQLSQKEIDTENKDNISPTIFAMHLNRKECFSLLTSYGAKVENTLRCSSQYKNLTNLWQGNKEIDENDVKNIIDSENLDMFFENIMEFSQVSLREKFTKLVFLMAKKGVPIEWFQYFMIITDKIDDKDAYDFFRLLAEYFPSKLKEIKNSSWNLTGFEKLFAMAYANDDPYLFNYFLAVGENPYWALDGNLIGNNGLKIQTTYQLWYSERLSRLSKKLNSDLKFTDMNELAKILIELFDTLLNQLRPSVPEVEFVVDKSHNEFWINAFVLLIRGVNQLDRVPPMDFLHNFYQTLDFIMLSSRFQLNYINGIKSVMTELSKNRFINDFLVQEQKNFKECILF